MRAFIHDIPPVFDNRGTDVGVGLEGFTFQSLLPAVEVKDISLLVITVTQSDNIRLIVSTQRDGEELSPFDNSKELVRVFNFPFLFLQMIP